MNTQTTIRTNARKPFITHEDGTRPPRVTRTKPFIIGLALAAALLIPHTTLAAAPAIDNANGASNVLSISATLCGTLTSTGGVPTRAYAYWGESDGGTTNANWSHASNLGTNAAGPLSLAVTNLTPNRLYYYRFYATNLSGQAWATTTTNFTTLAASGPAFVVLGEATHFTLLAGAEITYPGAGTVIGDIGAYPYAGSGIHVPAAQVTGTVYSRDATYPLGASVIANDLLLTAQNDLTTAYNHAAGLPPGTGPFLNPGTTPGHIGGMTLVPGVYTFDTSTDAIIDGADLTLTGGPDDVWVFQMGRALIVEAGALVRRKVILAGGAQARNVFWQVGASAELGTYCEFKGTIMADQHIVLDVGSVLEGRALARIAHIVFGGLSANLPAAAAAVTNLTLTVISEHGIGTPPAGLPPAGTIYTNSAGTTLTNSISGMAANGGTQYVATGWSMVGNAPVSGSGTNLVMTQTNNAVLTWNWSTNYLLNTSAGLGGSVTGSTNGFYIAGSTAVVRAVPGPGYDFAGWTGNVSGPATNNAVLSLTMDQARTAVAHFVLDDDVAFLQLTILSAHGIGQPSTGVYVNVKGTTLTNRISGLVSNGGTQYVATGWSMTGNAPVSGSGTNMVMTQTNNAVLTWNWNTNYALTLSALHGAITNAAPGWKPADSLVTLYPQSDFGYTFDHWVLNGQSDGAGVPLIVTMAAAQNVIAVFSPLFVDVTAQVSWNANWVFDPRKGYFLGTLTIANTNSLKVLLAPIWFEVQSTEWFWLRNPTGFDANTGMFYTNISYAVTNQLRGIGNGDQALDPGESVTVTGIELMGRRSPDNVLVMAVWADPPGTLAKPVDTDGDGMPDVNEYIAGTSATDPNSAFRIRLGPDGRSVQWDSSPHRLYTVLTSTNLLQGFVAATDNIEGTGAPTTFSATPQVSGGDTPGTVFYRVQVRIK